MDRWNYTVRGRKGALMQTVQFTTKRKIRTQKLNTSLPNKTSHVIEENSGRNVIQLQITSSFLIFMPQNSNLLLFSFHFLTLSHIWLLLSDIHVPFIGFIALSANHYHPISPSNTPNSTQRCLLLGLPDVKLGR